MSETGPAGGTGASGERARGFGFGPAATLVVLGLLVGLAVGWIAWRGTSASNAGDAASGGESGEYVDGIDVSNDPVLGSSDAPVTIVEFSDFECPFCARFARLTAPRLRAQYGDRIRWIFVNYPLETIHPRAFDAALAGECVHAEGKFWQFYDAMFGGGHDLSRVGLADAAERVGADRQRFQRCLEDAEHAAEVAADIAEGRKFYIFGTPAFFINGIRVEGALPAESFATVIDSILAGS